MTIYTIAIKKKEGFYSKIFSGGFYLVKNSLIILEETNLIFEKQFMDSVVALNLWRREFFEKWEQISSQGFDLTFKRMWNFYLSYCEAGFKSKNIDLIQFHYLINRHSCE